MKMTTSEQELRLLSRASKKGLCRQWRNWRTGMVIESIDHVGHETDVWWDKEFESVVLFHCPDEKIIFCDPLDEAIKREPRYDGCVAITLSEYARLKDLYGGENTHGDLCNRTKYDLTLESLLDINSRTRQDFNSLLQTLTQ